MTNDMEKRRLQQKLVKDTIKEAIKEWMDERYASTKQTVGGAVIKCFCVLGFCLFIKIIVHYHIGNLNFIYDMVSDAAIEPTATH